MKRLLPYIDDILLLVGCILLIIAGAYIHIVLALYTAAAECLALAYLYSRASIPKGEPGRRPGWREQYPVQKEVR